MRQHRMVTRTIRTSVVVAMLVAAPLVPAAAQTPGEAAVPTVSQTPAATAVAAEPAPDISLDEVPVVLAPSTEADAPADAAARRSAAADEADASRVRTEEIATDGHQSVGLTWAATDALVDVEVRTRTDGEWTEWVELANEAAAPDTGTAESDRTLRGGTGSVWIGDADAVQLSFPSAADVPADARVALVGAEETVETPARDGETTGRAAAATTTADAEIAAVVAAPSIISRSQWGAAPQACPFAVASTLLAAVVHHTAGPNSYASPAEAMQQLRNDQRYHQQARGWCDLGYNFVVDKWGNIYEGRANSGTQPVIGVHAGGFNTATVGISMLGDYSSITPSSAVQESVARLVAWRMAAYHRDPTSTVGYTTLGGENSRFPAGTTLALQVVIGHRDVAYSACPGQLGYNTLGFIRARAKQLIGASFINPALSSRSVAVGSSVGVTAGVLSSIDWTLRVTDARTGLVMRSLIGTAGPSGGSTVVTWDGRSSAGNPVGTGPFRLTLTGTETGSGVPVVAWSDVVQVTGRQNPPTVAPVALTGDLRFVPLTPARVLDTRPTGASLGAASRVDVQVAGVAGVPADAKAVALNVTAVNSSGVTHVRAWPAGNATPGTSVLNTDGSRTSAAAALVGVGGQGRISLYNDAGSTHLVADVTGYYTSATGAGQGYGSLASAHRALDTRTSGGPIAPKTRRTVQLAGVGGVPSDAQAVVLNVVSVRSGGAGFVAVAPKGAAVGSTSTVNHQPGRDVSNRTVVALQGGAVDVYVDGTGVNVVVDVVGWYGPSGTERFTPVVPVRAFDTRSGGGPIGQAATRTFDVVRATGLPAGTRSVALNLTATRQTSAATYLSVWGAGARPLTSDLNTGAGRDQANLAFVAPSAGNVSVYNNLGSTHVVGDVFGYFR